MSSLLYRGINQVQYQSLLSQKLLEPKGYEFSLILTYDGDFKYDGGITYDKSQQNAIAGHQKHSEKYKTSGISTTPHKDRAMFYALCRTQTAVGYILIFEKSKLVEKGIELYVVADYIPSPEVPQDSEVILVTKDNKPISTDFIKRIEKVERSIV